MISNNKLMKVIGKNIKYYRNMYGNSYTQEKLAEVIDSSVSLIAVPESTKGNAGFSLYTLYKIAYVLNTPINYFFETSFKEIDANTEKGEMLNATELYLLVGRNVKFYRLNYSLYKNKLTQRELAKMAKVSPSTISNLESDNIDAGVSIYNLYKISIALDTPIEKFFELPPNEKKEP